MYVCVSVYVNVLHKCECACASKCVCTCQCEFCVCLHIEARGAHLWALFLRHHVFMRQHLTGSWNPQVRLGWLASKPQGSVCLFLLGAGITSLSYCAWPFTRVWRSNLGPHAGIVHTSLTQPFLRSCSWLLEAFGGYGVCMWRTHTASGIPVVCVCVCV